MTNPAIRHRPAARWRWLAVVAVAALALSGCDLATGTVRTVTRLRDAGIRNPQLNVENSSADLVYDSGVGPLQRLAEEDRAAQIIWENLPLEIQRITVSPREGGFEGERVYPRAVLEARFGPRPAGLDKRPGDIARRVVLGATIGFVVLLVLVVLIIVLIVRAARRRPAAPPGGGWQGGHGQQPGYGPPGGQPGWPQQPGYGQQAGWPQQPGYGQPWPPPGPGQPGAAGPGWGQAGGQSPAWPPPEAGRQAPTWPEAGQATDDWPESPPPESPPPESPPPESPPPAGRRPDDTAPLEPPPPERPPPTPPG
jgi:hypothetical protein